MGSTSMIQPIAHQKKFFFNFSRKFQKAKLEFATWQATIYIVLGITSNLEMI